VFHFSNRFLGHKLLDREHLGSWRIVMVENPIVGPKFRSLSLLLLLLLLLPLASSSKSDWISWRLLNNFFYRVGWLAPRPTPILEDQASVFISPRGGVATHFSRLLRHTWVKVGLLSAFNWTAIALIFKTLSEYIRFHIFSAPVSVLWDLRRPLVLSSITFSRPCLNRSCNWPFYNFSPTSLRENFIGVTCIRF
jgi:hypothetical protein